MAGEIPPLITLLSDFGLADFYVSAMKASVLRHCPSARLVDVTHLVPRHDIVCGSINLERALEGFGCWEDAVPGDPDRRPASPGSGPACGIVVHLAVVDPGVGSKRRLLVVEIGGQVVVCPDNGLITWAWRRVGGGRAHELRWRPEGAVSEVFHGRDIMGPVAGMIASGVEVGELGRAIEDPVLLDLWPSETGDRGVVIHVDGFGNAMTNIPAELVDRGRARQVRVKERSVGPLRRTYAEVEVGEALVLIGSSGLVEIAVREGSAAQVLGVRVGDGVEVLDGDTGRS